MDELLIELLKRWHTTDENQDWCPLSVAEMHTMCNLLIAETTRLQAEVTKQKQQITQLHAFVECRERDLWRYTEQLRELYRNLRD